MVTAMVDAHIGPKCRHEEPISGVSAEPGSLLRAARVGLSPKSRLPEEALDHSSHPHGAPPPLAFLSQSCGCPLQSLVLLHTLCGL